MGEREGEGEVDGKGLLLTLNLGSPASLSLNERRNDASRI